MKYDNLQKLIEVLKEELQPTNISIMTYKNNNYILKSSQSSIIRTNCIDCLDRTNVVQSITARYMLW